MTLQEVQRNKDRLDALFRVVAQVTPGGAVHSHMVRYLCVQVSGFLDQTVQTIYYEYARRRSTGNIATYVSKTLERRSNFNADRLVQLVRQFDGAWAKDLEAFLTLEHRTTLGSLVVDRNAIAHGRDVTLGFHTMKDWYTRVLEVVTFLEHQAA